MPEPTVKVNDPGEGAIGISVSVLEKHYLEFDRHPASVGCIAKPASASTLHRVVHPDL